MSRMIIPLTTDPNQTLTVTPELFGRNAPYRLTLRYNEIAGYWVLTIYDPATKRVVADSIPLLTGAFPAADLLGQHQYLGLGSLVLINATGAETDHPDDTNLGVDFLLVWTDETPDAVASGLTFAVV